MEIDRKLERLKMILREYGSIAIAFSGGTDSTFLLKVAHDVLGENAIAITARSSVNPEWEYIETLQFTKNLGIEHIVIDINITDIEAFRKNPENRCYFCKKEIFTRIQKAARDHGISNVADGSNVDDLDDYRPGMLALKELGVYSPLREAGFTKKEVREASKEMGLPTWDKPAFACLASRIPYGDEITKEKLKMIEQAEEYLFSLGFRQLRVRHHRDLARIEVAPEDRSKFFDKAFMDMVNAKFKEIGYKYTALDLAGYRMGSLNESVLGKDSVSD